MFFIILKLLKEHFSRAVIRLYNTFFKDPPKEQDNHENKTNGNNADAENKNGENEIKEENKGKKKRGQNKNRPVYKMEHKVK